MTYDGHDKLGTKAG